MPIDDRRAGAEFSDHPLHRQHQRIDTRLERGLAARHARVIGAQRLGRRTELAVGRLHRKNGLVEVEEPDIGRKLQQARRALQIAIYRGCSVQTPDLRFELEHEAADRAHHTALIVRHVVVEHGRKEDRIVRRPSVGLHFSLDQRDGHVDRVAAILDRGGRREVRVASIR